MRLECPLYQSLINGSLSLSLSLSLSHTLPLLYMLMTALQQNWLHADTSLSLLSVRPSVSVSLCLYLCISLCMSLYVCLSLCHYLSVSLCLCVSLSSAISSRTLLLTLSRSRSSLCLCLSLVVWFRHEFISVCVSGGPDSTDHWADFLTFYFFSEYITYVCNVCGVGATYKMVWSKYQNCTRFDSYVTYHIYIHIFSFTQHMLLFLIHSC